VLRSSIVLCAMNSRVERQRNPSGRPRTGRINSSRHEWRKGLPGSRQLQADALLLVVALIWGSTFVLVKRTVAQFPVYAFLSLRFALAAVVLLLLFGRRLQGFGRRELWAGASIGLFLFGGYAFQTLGLQYTTASKAGFITGLSVVMVPVFSALLLRRVADRRALLGVVCSTIGLALLTLEGDLRPAYGDWLVLACAFCFALHIISVGAFAPHMDALALTIVQVVVVALLSGAMSLVTESRSWSIPGSVGPAAVFTGVLGTAFAFATQNSVQTWTTATHTALIFATEPVFAAVFGYLWAGERLTQWGTVGCGLILLGMLFAELRSSLDSQGDR